MNTPIELEHYYDGVPSVLRKKTVYTDLFFYRKSDVLVQLTKAFCERFLPRYGDRTVDQMVQAARSIKQNIAEGFTDGQTSFETEIKLLGIARGSNQELLEDYQDYIKQYGLCDWGAGIAGKTNNSRGASHSSDSRSASHSSHSSDSRDASDAREASSASNASSGGAAPPHPRLEKMLAFCRTHNDLPAYQPFFTKWTDEEMANIAICLCHMVDRAMASFIKKRDREFVEEGGVRERMTAARLERRGTQKQIIDEQQHLIADLRQEILRLQAQVASLQRELNNLKDNR